MITHATAPAKLILAGEHAILHGAEALALALDLKSHVTLDNHSSFVLEVPHLAQTLDPSQSLDHSHPLSPIMRAVHDLIKLTETPGSKITLSSEIPFGFGLGSSASVFTALTLAWLKRYQLDLDACSLIHQFEHYAHQRASVVDSHTILHGGCWLFSSQREPVKITFDPQHWFWINTGRPMASTADCVRHTLPLLSQREDLLTTFDHLTHRLKRGLFDSAPSEIHHAIRGLNQALCEIGVVPKTTQNLISTLEAYGASAKVSGAGSIAGENAGAIIIYAPNGLPESMSAQPIRLASQGGKSWSE